MFHASILPHLVDDIVPEANYGLIIQSLHSSTVNKAIADAGRNRVLNRIPPAISSSEIRLPRDWRCALSQLRSGFSKYLREFLHRIGAADAKCCPDCNVDDHTSSHLFSCPRFPTSLSPIDLWVNPITSAIFLSSQPSFSNLSDVNPPAPRPPPEPPPG